VEQSGATYVPLGEVDLEQPRARLGAFDAVIEATGAVELSVGMLGALAPNGVLDLVGGPPERKAVPIHAALLGAMVGRNLTLLGSVNANPDDWVAAVNDLAEMRRTYPGVLERLITHEFTMDDADVAFERVPGQIKAIISLVA
jgi:threonine dehydrogenase-like Zn-dependent dehydrogenase